jgi:hypothetical protein
MAEYVKLNEGAFRRGVNATLTLKPLRDAARSLLSGKVTTSCVKSPRKVGHSIEVSRSSKTASWHVKRAS